MRQNSASAVAADGFAAPAHVSGNSLGSFTKKTNVGGRTPCVVRERERGKEKIGTKVCGAFEASATQEGAQGKGGAVGC